MAMNGPIGATCNVADDLGWAHFGCLQQLLMILDGPILAAYKSC
jgi:hypothetical protein